MKNVCNLYVVIYVYIDRCCRINNNMISIISFLLKGSHRLKYLNSEVFFDRSLKINYALKSTAKSLKDLEKSLNSSVFCRNKHS